jgi:predicted O-methyltransferase YrrM
MNFSALLWRLGQLNQYWKCEFSEGWSVSEIEHLRAARIFARHGSSIESVKEHLQILRSASMSEIEIIDFGAVSGVAPQAGTSTGIHRKVDLNTMISTTASSEKWGRMLLRIAQLKSGKFNLELGTNLGVGLRYLVTGSHFQHAWISIEGDPNTANIAKTAFQGSNQVSIVTGRFSEVLPTILHQNQPFHLAFIDGHHDGTATQMYAEQISLHMNSEGWMILDDIRWSRSMKWAWDELKGRSWVDRWVDLGKMGILVIK